MTIDEAQVIYDQSCNGTLRKPNCMLTNDVESINGLLKSLNALILFQSKDENRGLFRKFKYLKYKHKTRSHSFVKKFNGKGSSTEPYQIQTVFGDGEFFDLHNLFQNGQIPEYVEKGHCFANCIAHAMDLAQKGIESTILTGISYFTHPYLHAVLLIKYPNNEPKVVDFNYDLVMDYNLFLKLYSFEVLSSINGQKLLNDRDILGARGVDLKDYQLLLAYDDGIRYKKDKLNLLNSKTSLANESKPKALKNKNNKYSTFKDKNDEKLKRMPEFNFDCHGRIF